MNTSVSLRAIVIPTHGPLPIEDIICGVDEILGQTTDSLSLDILAMSLKGLLGHTQHPKDAFKSFFLEDDDNDVFKLFKTAPVVLRFLALTAFRATQEEEREQGKQGEFASFLFVYKVLLAIVAEAANALPPQFAASWAAQGRWTWDHALNVVLAKTCVEDRLMALGELCVAPRHERGPRKTVTAAAHEYTVRLLAFRAFLEDLHLVPYSPHVARLIRGAGAALDGDSLASLFKRLRADLRVLLFPSVLQKKGCAELVGLDTPVGIRVFLEEQLRVRHRDPMVFSAMWQASRFLDDGEAFRKRLRTQLMEGVDEYPGSMFAVLNEVLDPDEAEDLFRNAVEAGDQRLIVKLFGAPLSRWDVLGGGLSTHFFSGAVLDVYPCGLMKALLHSKSRKSVFESLRLLPSYDRCIALETALLNCGSLDREEMERAIEISISCRGPSSLGLRASAAAALWPFARTGDQQAWIEQCVKDDMLQVQRNCVDCAPGVYAEALPWLLATRPSKWALAEFAKMPQSLLKALTELGIFYVKICTGTSQPDMMREEWRGWETQRMDGEPTGYFFSIADRELRQLVFARAVLVFERYSGCVGRAHDLEETVECAIRERVKNTVERLEDMRKCIMCETENIEQGVYDVDDCEHAADWQEHARRLLFQGVRMDGVESAIALEHALDSGDPGKFVNTWLELSDDAPALLRLAPPVLVALRDMCALGDVQMLCTAIGKISTEAALGGFGGFGRYEGAA